MTHSGKQHQFAVGHRRARFTRPPSSDTILVSSTVYDNTGAVQTQTDPAGTVTCFSYDNAGREIQRMLNCTGGSSSSSSSTSSSGSSGGCPPSADTNMTIQTSYNADGNVSAVTAINSATGNQVTQYVYGTTLSNSGIASSLLKLYDVLPDSVGGSDQITYQYNRQREVTSITDQNGTVHSYSYDLLGRLTEDSITTLGSGVDGTVRRIETAYEVRGIVQMVTSYDNPTVGQGNIVNQVQLVYNNFGQLVTDYQSHSGAVNTSTTPSCQYGYANGSANTIRPISMTYPNGRVLNYNYGVGGGINDAASRIASLIDSNGITHLADYSYLGLSSIIQVNESQPGLTYTLLGLVPGNDPVTGDIYQGLDLFGRVKDLIWTSSGGSSSSSSSSSSSGVPSIVERIQHGYDRAGNRLWRKELVAPSETHDELYYYDGLYRLKDMQRGTLTAGNTAIAAETFEQCWSLDSTGNWQNFQQDNNGDGIWDLVQGRVSNTVNEITLINNSVGAGWVTPAYDKAGNMTTMPQPASPGSSYTAVYDAWNRLVGLSAGGSQVAVYQYDGSKRRAVKQVYSSGVLSQTRHFYYSSAWQDLEERVGSSSSADQQFVWGMRYIDDIVLRDRDSTGNGVLNERLYGMQDTSWNLTALAAQNGTLVERFAYSAYGPYTVLTPSFEPKVSSSYAWQLLFAGYSLDSESGLYSVRNRFLHPLLACFTSRDPIRSQLLTSLYEYVGSRPIKFVDPLGYQKFEAGAVGALQFCVDFCSGDYDVSGWLWVGAGYYGWFDIWYGISATAEGHWLHGNAQWLKWFNCGECDPCCKEGWWAIGPGFFKAIVEKQKGNISVAGIDCGVLVLGQPYVNCRFSIEFICLFNIIGYLGPIGKTLQYVAALLHADAKAGGILSFSLEVCAGKNGGLTVPSAKVCAGIFIEFGWHPSHLSAGKPHG